MTKAQPGSPGRIDARTYCSSSAFPAVGRPLSTETARGGKYPAIPQRAAAAAGWWSSTPPPALASAAASIAGMASPSESSGDSTAAAAVSDGMLGGLAQAVMQGSCDTSIIEMPFSEAHLTPLILDL